MSKDPAFLFYPADFLVGVAELSMEERGKYITLLCYMHQKGRLDEKTIRLLVGFTSEKLKSKFKTDRFFKLYNERLEMEAEKRRKFTESRRLNGSLGGRPKGTKNKFKKNHMGNHMENENINIKRGVQGGEKLIGDIIDPQVEKEREKMRRIYTNLKKQADETKRAGVQDEHLDNRKVEKSKNEQHETNESDPTTMGAKQFESSPGKGNP